MALIVVAPLAGARIEIVNCLQTDLRHTVAPLAGARIEIASEEAKNHYVLSLPSRERGLKSTGRTLALIQNPVAPLAGARIEIRNHCLQWWNPFTSLPSRERGLKSHF